MSIPPSRCVAYFGPEGTFTEQALLTQPDLASSTLVPMTTIADVLSATKDGSVDLGFVPIENSIEGTVSATIDALAFETDLLVQREVVIPIEQCLLARPGSDVRSITTVLSFPHASAQCRGYLAEHLPDATLVATNSTADGARLVSESGDLSSAAIGPALAAKVYGLEVLVAGIEDHGDNATRFVVVAASGVPAPTGHDKTSIVVFQRDDRPGSLLAILAEFAARSINLVKLESRPTKRTLGEYCFIIDLEGHLDDEPVAETLRRLRSTQGDVKFLGSYPAAGEEGPAARREHAEAWQEAASWVAGLRRQVQPRPTANG